jgi:L-ribulose-5-phosphate 4-epimerase
MKPDDMVVMNLEGKIVEGDYKPSVDLASHLELYKGFSDIEGVVHTHSHYATCFAQACRNIECMGTTHADFCWKDVPVTDILTDDEVREDYEKNIGLSIVRKVKESGRTEKECPAGLAANHGPFAWGETVEKAVENAVVLEEVAKMALNTLVLSEKNVMSQFLMEKHFRRKHGEKAYYGQ